MPKMNITFVLSIVLWISVITNSAFAEVRVSNEMRLSVLSDYFEIRARNLTRSNIGVFAAGDQIEVKVELHNKRMWRNLTVVICPESQLRYYEAGQRSNCLGRFKGKNPISFTYEVRSPGRYYVVLDNRYALVIKKKASLSVVRRGKMPKEMREAMIKGLEALTTSIQKTFVVPEFDLQLMPCGSSNAFSQGDSGDIVICTELLADTILKGQDGAFAGIVGHELGHTLLNLWGAPNWDNEETADEFAIAVLYRDGVQEKAYDLAQYFAAKNSQRDAAYIVREGDRHPISIQRTRNIQRILHNPSNTITRWYRLFYEHMKPAALKAVIDNPKKYDDIEYATQVLNRLPQASN